MNDTKYSVLMSVYEKEEPIFFQTSINSMLNQTIRPDQFVLVKNGPLTKELDCVIQNFLDSDRESLFTIAELDENNPLGIALDKGLQLCKNNLVARMDSDDISVSTRCEEELLCFEEDKELCIVGTNAAEFYDKPHEITTVREVPHKHEDIIKFMRRRSPFNHPSVMFKKSEVLRCGGYGTSSRKEDLDLFSRMINNHCKTRNIDKPLLLLRANRDNYRRRKSWTYCSEYIAVIYNNWKKGYCSLSDLLIVTLGQLFMFLAPLSIVKILTDKYLRKKINNI